MAAEQMAARARSVAQLTTSHNPEADGAWVPHEGVYPRPGFALADSSLAHNSAALTHDLREADHRDDVVLAHLAVVELAEEVGHLLGASKLRVVVLDLAR